MFDMLSSCVSAIQQLLSRYNSRAKVVILIRFFIEFEWWTERVVGLLPTSPSIEMCLWYIAYIGVVESIPLNLEPSLLCFVCSVLMPRENSNFLIGTIVEASICVSVVRPICSNTEPSLLCLRCSVMAHRQYNNVLVGIIGGSKW